MCVLMRANAQQKPSLNLQRLRLEAGLSQRGLAWAAGVSPGAVRTAEGGAIPYPPTQQAIAAGLSRALGRHISHLDLWELSDEPEIEVAP